MEQPSVMIEAPQFQKSSIATRYHWIHRFFSKDISPDNFPIVDLQRRAVWIALAIILQALHEPAFNLLRAFNETHPTGYIAAIIPVGLVISFALILGSFVAMWMAFRSVPRKQLSEHASRWQRTIFILTLLLTLVSVVAAGWSIVICFLPPQSTNDGTSLDANAAALLLRGHNPYADSTLQGLAQHFSLQPNSTTPLRLGKFANRLDYPTLPELRDVLSTDLKTGQTSEIETKVSYPALSFLSLVPLVWLKDYNVIPFYLLCHLALIVIAWKVARPELRPWVLLLALANFTAWTPTIGETLDIFYTLLLFVAWLLRDRSWSSAFFFGLALASKQIAWFFLPFYVVMAWRHYGPMEAVRRLVVACAVALAINLPFILWNPHAWLAGVLAPIADPMFPLGTGIINLSVTHVLPFFPTWVYSALESISMVVALIYYWRICPKYPEAALLLAVVPLFFAWRSLPSYFYGTVYPLFVLIVAKQFSGITVQHQSRSLAPTRGRASGG